jgi:hypothetical protein
MIDRQEFWQEISDETAASVRGGWQIPLLTVGNCDFILSNEDLVFVAIVSVKSWDFGRWKLYRVCPLNPPDQSQPMTLPPTENSSTV